MENGRAVNDVPGYMITGANGSASGAPDIWSGGIAESRLNRVPIESSLLSSTRGPPPAAFCLSVPGADLPTHFRLVRRGSGSSNCCTERALSHSPANRSATTSFRERDRTQPPLLQLSGPCTRHGNETRALRQDWHVIFRSSMLVRYQECSVSR